MKIHGIPVRFDPECVTVAQARGVWPFFRIVVGPAWYELEGEARAACLLHEVGHCRGHHVAKRLLMVPLIVLWWIGHKCSEVVSAVAKQQEIEADRYAADHGFALEMAQALDANPETSSPFYPHRDVRRSILLARHFKEASSC